MISNATHARNSLVILTLAVITAIIWYFVEPITFTADSYGYLDSARALALQENGSLVYYRAPLLPFLLAITGVPTEQTFQWFLLIQLGLGVSCTMLIYNSLRHISPVYGFISSLIFISTFIAFVHAKAVMSEELYLFGWCLLINGGLAYLTIQSRYRLLQITVALAILAMTRAQGTYVGVMVLPFLACYSPKRIPEIMVMAGSLLMLTLGISHYYAAKAKLIDEPGKSAQVSTLSITNTTGKMLFANIYIHPNYYMNWTLVRPENGPATQRLFSILKDYYSNPSNLHENPTDIHFGHFKGHPEALLSAMIDHPDDVYWWVIWLVLDKQIGASAADHLLLNVSLETLQAHPLKMMFIYTRNLVSGLLIADSLYTWTKTHETSMGAPLEKELVISANTPSENFNYFLNCYFPALQLILVVIATILCKQLWLSRFRWQWLFCMSLLFYNCVAVAVGSSALSRYTFYTFPVFLLIATMGFVTASSSPRSKKLF